MTVASETNHSGPYNGNGVTTVFNYGFRILKDTHLRVVKTASNGDETTLVLGADYIVSGVGASGGGQIACTSAPAAGTTITILRAVPFVQETDLENQGAYLAETVEDALDLSAMRDQQLKEQVDRAHKAPFGEAGSTFSAADVANAQENAAAAAASAVAAGISENAAAASAAAATNTATMVKNNQFWVREYGYVGDGLNHPLSEYFPSLALAQMAYPFASSLTQSIDWAASQKAINALEATITNGSFGGGFVVFPSGKGVFSDGLVITKSFVHLVGAGRQATLLSFRHATQDCILIDGPGNIRCQSVRDMFIEAPNSTAGYAIKMVDTYNVLVDRVMMEHVFNGIHVLAPANSTTIRDTLIMPTRPGSQYGINWQAAGDGSDRADVLYLNNVTMEGLWGNQIGVYWQGWTNTLVCSSLRILHMSYGMMVEQVGTDGSHYPSFLNAFDLEFEGFKSRALWIKDGAGFKIVASDINNLSGGDPSQGNADDYAIRIDADLSQSFTRSAQISDTRIGGCRQNGIWLDARDVLLSNIQFYTAGIGTANTYAAIRVGPNATSVHMVNIRGEEFGGAALVKSVVEIASGATRVTLANIDGTYCQTSAVTNNAGDANVSELHCIEPNGTIRSRVYESFTVGTGNAKAEGAIALFRKDQDAVTDVRLGNNSTGGNARIRQTKYTGIANAYHIDELNNASGAPVHHESVGSAVTAGMRKDAPKHDFRNVAGTQQAEINDNGVLLKSFTVAGLPAGAAAGSIAYASNGRKNGEGAGVGTGVLVFRDASGWKACDTGAAVAA